MVRVSRRVFNRLSSRDTTDSPNLFRARTPLPKSAVLGSDGDDDWNLLIEGIDNGPDARLPELFGYDERPSLASSLFTDFIAVSTDWIAG